MFDGYNRFLEKRKETGLLRSLSSSSPSSSPLLLDFSSSDYLGLSHHPQVLQAAHTAGERWGTSGRSSRLLIKGENPFETLEKKIARSLGTEEALIFATGYQANAGVLAALLDPEIHGEPPLVFSDRLNHASLHDGCRRARVPQIRYRHLDLNHLEEQLKKHRHQKKPKFILTESLYSMEGDSPALEDLSAIAQMYNAFLYVDEAHAVGVLGGRGYGLCADIPGKASVVMGSFSKGVGTSGGYIGCSRQLKQYLVNRCTDLIYSTAPSPLIIGATSKAWDLIPVMDAERAHLKKLSATLQMLLKNNGFETGGTDSPIVSLRFKSRKEAERFHLILSKQGVITSFIRPPTLPPGDFRLRLSLTCNHTLEQIHVFSDFLRAIPSNSDRV